ncbi:MAG: L,D-transpeptidase family protein [Cytophagaceae bacterium]|nr:L,D-transpeptidase family protein [Cytophagaceae bacterium]
MLACKNNAVINRKPAPDVDLNITIEKSEGVSYYLDTVHVVEFLKDYAIHKNYQNDLELFYKKRNYEFAWMNSAGLNEYSSSFINLLNQERNLSKQDSTLYYNRLPNLYHFFLDPNQSFSNKDSLLMELELLLTINFFDYAKRNWKGGSDENLKQVRWFIARKKMNYETLLDTILTHDPHKFSSFEPVYRQYGLLKNYLLKYRAIEESGGWKTWTDKVISLKKGDSSDFVLSAKNQLYLLGDLSKKDTSYIFDSPLEDAVKKFQKRHGLSQDGIITGKTRLALSVPLRTQIEQLLINMERGRWVPLEPEGDYLVVNIPDFKLYVYTDDSIAWTCNVIVGSSSLRSNTVIFNDNIEYIVFSPYWNIPEHIIIKETLPAIKKNPNYLIKHDMEVVNMSGKVIPISSINWQSYTNHFPYIIRQKPGRDNALGQVKFLFPNSYDIYMHDTPVKSLFGESSRMFSHGCIRLEDPYKLAQFLLRDDAKWSDRRIKASMSDEQQLFVRLKKKVPVFIAYFTSWVDRNGELNFREDVYHHDEEMRKLLIIN